ncbi:hypothetical protein ACU4GA_01615 [Methylobacterium oryzae CBMB20]
MIAETPVREAASRCGSPDPVISEAVMAEATAARGGRGSEIVVAEAVIGEAARLCLGSGRHPEKGAGKDCRCNRCDRPIHDRHSGCVASTRINVAPDSGNPASFVL